MTEDDRRAEQSRRILDRIAKESEAGGRSPVTRGAERMRGHLGASDADQTDAIEVWGTRIGRALGLVVFVALVGWLVLSFLGKI